MINERTCAGCGEKVPLGGHLPGEVCRDKTGILDLTEERAHRAISLLEVMATRTAMVEDFEELKQLLGEEQHDILLHELFHTPKEQAPSIFRLFAKVLRVVYAIPSCIR